MDTVSVCIPSTRPDHLDRCLASLKAQRPVISRFEVLVCAQAPGVAECARARYPDAIVVEVGRRNPRLARNLLIERAGGELLLFLDDDVVAPPSLLFALVGLAGRHQDVDVFGGPNLTVPGSSRFQATQGAVLASHVGTGPVHRRYHRSRRGAADDRSFTLCNLAVRRRAMLPFAVELAGGEENALLHELAGQGRKMLYHNDLVVYHERRATIRSFAAQIFKYGVGRGALIRRSRRTTRLLYLAPTGFLLYLATLPLLATITPWLLLPLLLYATGVGGACLWIALRTSDAFALPLGACLIALMHACYGAGVARGVLSSRGTSGMSRLGVAAGSVAGRRTEP